MFVHKTKNRVRYAETDKMGYMYYGNYAMYFEIGRVEAIRSLGISYKELEDSGIIMPVMNMEMRFVRPARYDENLTIETTIKTIPKKSITFFTNIYNENNKLVNGGRIKLVFVDSSTNKTIDVPDSLISKLKPYFEENQS